LKSPKAYIINLCSVASIKAYTNGGSYAITKAALLAFSSNLREELKTSNIKVTSVLPGPTYTDSWSSAGIPEERFMPAEDVAEIIYTVSQLSGQTVIEEILMRPQLGDI
jgi:short-subunit dehydrogenase